MAARSGARTTQVNCSKITCPETPAGRLVEDLSHNRTAQLVRHMVNGITYEQLQYDTGARAQTSTNVRGFATRTTRNETTQGWRDAILLKKGGKLLLKGGDADTEPSIKIVDVRTERKTLPVFNIEVANAHTFFIGVDGEVVHNAACGSDKPPIGKRNNYSSKKDAYEDAKRAGRGKEPIHHANGHPSNPTPHYHPNVKDSMDWTPKVPREHDHYFYP